MVRGLEIGRFTLLHWMYAVRVTADSLQANHKELVIAKASSAEQ